MIGRKSQGIHILKRFHAWGLSPPPMHGNVSIAPNKIIMGALNYPPLAPDKRAHEWGEDPSTPLVI